MAELQTLLADDGGSPCDGARRPGCIEGRAAPRAWNEPRVGGEILIGAHVQNDGASRRADEPRKLVGCDRVRCRHVRSSPERVFRNAMLGLAPRGEIATSPSGDRDHDLDRTSSLGLQRNFVSVRASAAVSSASSPSAKCVAMARR